MLSLSVVNLGLIIKVLYLTNLVAEEEKSIKMV